MLIFHSLKCITEIPNNEPIHEKIEKFWEIENFGTKTTVHGKCCNDITSNEVNQGIRYNYTLKMIMNFQIIITIAKTRLKHLVKSLSSKQIY